MNKVDNHHKFIDLRGKLPCFTFESYTLTKFEYGIHLQFKFNLNDCHFFTPELEFPIKDKSLIENIDIDDLRNAAFHIGMIELLSYWKASCSPKIIIKPFSLSNDQIIWWKKLYYKGLGEFFYLNSITTDFDSFVEISSESNKATNECKIVLKDELILPIGGGKDSIVSLESLKTVFPDLKPLILNSNPSRINTINKAGIEEANIIQIKRNIHPHLLELNKQGFLNGHTPFSAVLAFVSIFCALIYNRRNIALSNESSANEATDLISGANHQYSKSFEFEEDFRSYSQEYIHPELNYFSFLRPLNELQIARFFSKYSTHFSTFRSCNVGSKTNKWCENCSKCLFTYIILSPFIDDSQLKNIFKSDLLSNTKLKNTFDELIGIKEVKPFECVGTYEDVNIALKLILNKFDDQELPDLLTYYKTTFVYQEYINSDPELYLAKMNEVHFLDTKFLRIMKDRFAC